MRKNRRNTILWIVVSLILVGLLAWVMPSASPALADTGKNGDYHIVKKPECKPTKPTKKGPPEGSKERDDDKPLGAHIELQVPSAPPGAWGVVQWEDKERPGIWHNVEGWHGEIGGDGFERWWVGAKDFNTGPFRWVVTQGPGGPELGVSQPFMLPSGANQVLPIDVSLE